MQSTTTTTKAATESSDAAASAMAMAAWNAYASIETAEHSYADNVMRCTMLHATDLIGVTKTEIRKAKRILEIGCGTGAFGLAYMNMFPQGIPGQTIVCTDLSPVMVQVAQRIMTEKQQHQPTPSNTEFLFQASDGTTLEGLDDKSFDLVVSVFGIFLIPDRTAALQQIRRVLVDGGTLATTAWTSTGYNEELLNAGFGPNLHDAMAVMKVLPKDTAPEDRKPQPLPPFVLDWFDRDKVKNMLTENDYFCNVDIHRSLHTMTFDNVNHMWNALTPAMAMGHAAVEPDPEQVALAKESLGQFVTQGDKGAVDRPFTVQTVSNIIVAS
jgi:ubiquinone/menaquinone biosynthesis C-methylase UbiE